VWDKFGGRRFANTEEKGEGGYNKKSPEAIPMVESLRKRGSNTAEKKNLAARKQKKKNSSEPPTGLGWQKGPGGEKAPSAAEFEGLSWVGGGGGSAWAKRG